MNTNEITELDVEWMWSLWLTLLDDVVLKQYNVSVTYGQDFKISGVRVTGDGDYFRQVSRSRGTVYLTCTAEKQRILPASIKEWTFALLKTYEIPQRK